MTMSPRLALALSLVHGRALLAKTCSFMKRIRMLLSVAV